ncbi:MAG TPA: ATP-dependent DNA ligase [Candidatus Thermoplasmatota archaeon]|nr:ATP-dependent DNA ligase [Candidatus Thermoplasmatota archaeon]
MDYARLCSYYDRLSATRARLELTGILVELVKEADAEDLPRIVYLTQGKLYPDFVGVELGLAEKLVIRALVFATGHTEEAVVAAYHAAGDLGDAAEKLLGGEVKAGRKTAAAKRQSTLFGFSGPEEETSREPLTVARAYAAFESIAQSTGPGSQERKLATLQDLLLGTEPRQARYLVRTVTGKLRLGIADMTLLDALAQAYATKEDKAALERAYNVSSDLGLVARRVREGGLDALSKLQVRVGVPLRAMLAERLPTAEEILAKLGGKAAVEYKYDGLRVQAHIPESGPISFFSRRLENLTVQFPDVAQALRASMRGREAVVEGEVVAVDKTTGEMLPFQETSQRRGRKRDLDQVVEDVPVAIYLFDCLLADGEDLTGRTLPERRAALTRLFPGDESVRLSHYRVVETSDELVRIFDESVADGAEGIMCKSIAEDSTYRAGARGWQWIKFKRDYRAELSDSLDLVVVGAFTGRGRRKGWHGALLMAAYNREEDVFETVCKLGTGFDDATLAALVEELAPTTVEARHPRVRSRLAADTWFVPTLVAEVRGAELTLSPIHTALADVLKSGSGVAVRFPRFTGTWRRDKAPEDATSTAEVLAMYQGQRRGAAEDAPGEGTDI